MSKKKYNSNPSFNDDIDNFIEKYSILTNLENTIKECVNIELKDTKDKTKKKVFKETLKKIDNNNKDIKVLIINPDLVNYIKKLDIDEIKNLSGDNIIKFPGLIIIK